MIFQIFDDTTGEHKSTVEYFDRTPKGEHWTEGELKPTKGKPVLTDPTKKKISIMNDKQFAEHKIKLGLMELKQNETLDEKGNIIEKSIEQKLNDKIISIDELKKSLKQKINLMTEEKITSGFRIEFNGKTFTYDTTLEDQFNIKTIADLEIDSPLRCVDSLGKKTFVAHTKSQIQSLVKKFAEYKMQILIEADKQKLEIDSLTEINAILNYKE